MKLTRFERELLNRIQEDLPLTSRPFAAIGEELGVTEERVITTIRRLKSRKIIRRLGGIFSSRKLGCYTTLVVGIIPPERLPDAVRVINSYDEVTHNYLRDHRYNAWFTVIARSKNRARQVIREIRKKTGISTFHELPSERLYKLDLQLAL